MENGFDHKEREKRAAMLLSWATFCIVLLCAAMFMNIFTRCSIEPRVDESPAVAGPGPNQCEGGLGVGETLSKNCPDGQLGEIIVLCKEVGSQPEVQKN